MTEESLSTGRRGAILLMGLPGAGKGTQAFNLTGALSGFVHVDTGAEIYRRINDPAFAEDPTVQEQKRIYNEGLLNTPDWVAALLAERIRTYAGQGKGIIFSGSPRTISEAEAVVPLLTEIYGEEQILVLILGVSEETAKRRSLDRLVCGNPGCRYPTTKNQLGKACPQCGREFTDDRKTESWKVTKIDERFTEFRERTLPTIEYLLSLELAETIDAERTREEVSADVIKAVKRRFERESRSDS
jgi:adenylate kinase family enzyme